MLTWPGGAGLTSAFKPAFNTYSGPAAHCWQLSQLALLPPVTSAAQVGLLFARGQLMHKHHMQCTSQPRSLFGTCVAMYQCGLACSLSLSLHNGYLAGSTLERQLIVPHTCRWHLWGCHSRQLLMAGGALAQLPLVATLQMSQHHTTDGLQIA